jgi:hypothetical protein
MNGRQRLPNRRTYERMHSYGAFVEGPDLGDAKFYAQWLRAAAKAEALWKTIQFDDPYLELCVVDIPDLGRAAINLISRIKSTCCVISTAHSEDMEELIVLIEFVLLVRLGFFARIGGHYRMIIPVQEPDIDALKAAATMLAQAGDENCICYPRSFISVMSQADGDEKVDAR